MNYLERIERKSDPAVAKNRKLVIFHFGTVRDLIQGLPVDRLQELGSFEVTWVVLEGNGVILHSCLPERKFMEADPGVNLGSFQAVIAWLKKEEFGMALHLLSPWWVKLACLFAGIGFRAAPIGHLGDALVANSTVLLPTEDYLHMTEIYHRITAATFQIIQDDRGLPDLTLQPADTGIFLQYSLAPQQYYLVHISASPGLSRWPSQKYLELIRGMMQDFPVVVTCSRADVKRITPLQKVLASQEGVVWMGAQLNPEQRLDVISQSRVFVGPDSDEIHIAAACGIPVVGVYSRYEADRPDRWRPRGRLTVTVQPKDVYKDQHSLKNLAVRQVLEKVNKFS